MSTGTITTRPSTREDILAFYGQLPSRSVRAWTLLIDDEPAGIAGYRVDGDVIAVFSDVKETVPKMTIWRQAREFMRMLTFPAYCRCTETSGPFLERLGWQRLGGGIYKYEPR